MERGRAATEEELTEVEWIVRVGLVEEEEDAVDDGAEIEDGVPSFAQNVEANLAGDGDVGMVHFGVAVRLWWAERVVEGHCDCEVECGAAPEAGFGTHGDGEEKEVGRVREAEPNGGGKVSHR